MQAPNSERGALATILVIACVITRSDIGLARQSNTFDKMTIVFLAVALMIVTMIALLGWTAFFASFLPLVVALPLGLLIASLIFLFDQAVGASDWELAGVLRAGSPSAIWWGRLGARFCIACLLSLLTAAGATLWMFRGAIDNQLQVQRIEQNAPIEQEC